MKEIYRRVSSAELESPKVDKAKWKNHEIIYLMPECYHTSDRLDCQLLFKVTPYFPISSEYWGKFVENLHMNGFNNNIFFLYHNVESNVIYINPAFNLIGVKEQLIEFFKNFLPMPKIEYVEFRAYAEVEEIPLVPEEGFGGFLYPNYKPLYKE